MLIWLDCRHRGFGSRFARRCTARGERAEARLQRTSESVSAILRLNSADWCGKLLSLLPVERSANPTATRSRPAAFGSEPSATSLVIVCDLFKIEAFNRLRLLCIVQKVFGVGLSRTGTTTLAEFCKLLGLRVLHFDQVSAPESLAGFNFVCCYHLNFKDLTAHLPHSRAFNWTGSYDDVDAVFDLPTCAPITDSLRWLLIRLAAQRILL